MKCSKVRDLEGTWRGAAALYRCEPGGPLPDLVIVSSVNDHLAHETYIFASNEAGEVTDWTELDGSYLGGTSHESALQRAGYEVDR